MSLDGRSCNEPNGKPLTRSSARTVDSVPQSISSEAQAVLGRAALTPLVWWKADIGDMRRE